MCSLHDQTNGSDPESTRPKLGHSTILQVGSSEDMFMLAQADAIGIMISAQLDECESAFVETSIGPLPVCLEFQRRLSLAQP